MVEEVDVRSPAGEMKVGEEVMIQMSGVNKWFGQFHVLRNINFRVHKGERIVICTVAKSSKRTSPTSSSATRVRTAPSSS